MCFSAGKRICPSDTFQCANGAKCLDTVDLCDSANDCGDFSDEGYCSMYKRAGIYPGSVVCTKPCGITAVGAGGNIVPLKLSSGKIDPTHREK